MTSPNATPEGETLGEGRTTESDTAATAAAGDAPREEAVPPTVEDSGAESATADSSAVAEESPADPTTTHVATDDIAPDAVAPDTVEAQLAERTEDLQRVTAEYANYRRRTERERQFVIDTAKASVLVQLLPVLDDLELAENHGDMHGPLKAFRDKLAGVLTTQKLEAFGEAGEEFDPEIHEAVQDLSSGDDKALDTVLRRGYRLGDKVLRTAMVVIGDPVSAGGDAQAESAAESADAES